MKRMGSDRPGRTKVGEPSDAWGQAGLAGVTALLLMQLLLLLSSPSPSCGGTLGAAETAWIHLLRGERDDAASLARVALAEGSDSARAAACLTEALARDHREEAEEQILRFERRERGAGLTAIARGVLARTDRDPATAARRFREALEFFESEGDGIASLCARECLAVTLRDAGSWSEAVPHLERVRSRARELGRTLEPVVADYGLAYCAVARGDFPLADSLASAAVSEAERLDIPRWIGDGEGLLGTLRWIELDLEGTVTRLRIACDAFERSGDDASRASSLRRLAATRISLGELAAALVALREARELSLAAGALAEASYCLEHLGSLNDHLGNAELALRQWRTALEEGADSWPPEWIVTAYLNIASAHTDRGETAEALEVLDRVAAILRESESRLTLPDVLIRSGRARRLSGDLARARIDLLSALRVARELVLPLSEATALLELAASHAAGGRSDSAATSFDSVEKIARGRGFHEIDIAVHIGRADLAKNRGDLDLAQSQLDEAIAVAEKLRRGSRESPSVSERAFGRWEDLYGRAIALRAARHAIVPDGGHAGLAHDLASRAKARSLLDLLTETGTELRYRADPAFRDQEDALLNRLATLDTQRNGPGSGDEAAEIERLEDELAILEASVRRADARYAAIRYPAPPGIDEIRRERLGEGDVLLEYFLGSAGAFVWIVTRDSLRMEELAPRAQIERDVRALLPLLHDYNILGSDPTYYHRPALRLSRQLLAPAAAEIAEARRLIVVPHGILHHLPFETLPFDPGAVPMRFTGDSDGREPVRRQPARRFRDIPFLVRHLDIVYLPAVGLLEPRTAASAEGGVGSTLLLVGDPEIEPGGSIFLGPGSGATGRPVPSGRKELESLSRVWATVGEVRTLAGAEASVAALFDLSVSADSTPDLLHFTTHGIFNERRPRFSGLLLSPTGDDDGFLSLSEVFALDLRCDQVVLSACSSALGEEVTGEGIAGLTRGFLYAGARNVVATLWEISGVATTRFMIDFYGFLAVDPAGDRARALGRAKRRSIESSAVGAAQGGDSVDLAHPFFWAPFVMTGSGR